MYKSTSHKSKWVKTKWLMGSSSTKHYVPDTAMFTKSNLSHFIYSYRSVYFKPVDGTGGAKIVKLTRHGESFNAKYNKTKKTFTSLDGLYKWMKNFSGSRGFILQKGIQLAKSNGQPFDIRVMMQRDKNNLWSCTAIFCKIGKAGKVATNYHQGGHLQFLDKTLENAGFSPIEIEQTKANLKKLGYKVAKVFSSKSKGFKELGLDVALDKHKRLHILEVNTRPQFYPLKQLKNKSLYNKIVSYAKHYGRKGR